MSLVMIEGRSFILSSSVQLENTLYKVGDKVPQAGRYQCVVCGLILEFLPQHIEKGVVFNFCPLCFAGTENGPKKQDEDIWKFIG